MKHLMFLALVAVFIYARPVQALVYVEPTVGYFNGTYKFEQNFQGDLEREAYTTGGLSYGGRLGLSWFGWQLGPEYLRNNLTMDGDSVNINEWTAMLGYRLVFFRLYGGYIYKAEIQNSKYDPGTGYKAGLTFYLYRHMALNLEYRYVKYKTYDVPGFDLTYKNEYAGYALMLSFPFET
jgi:opacity protein-like surface antigen